MFESGSIESMSASTGAAKAARGKFLGRFVVSPVFLQRAVIIALLSFFFLLAMITAFSFRGHFGYLILAAAFLVINLFTLTGIRLRRSEAVQIFEGGIEFKGRFIQWHDIVKIDFSQPGSPVLALRSGEKILLPESIDRREELAGYLKSRIRQ